MNMAIDIGNSYAKVALFEGDELRACHRYKRMSAGTLGRLVSRYSPKKAIVCNVGRAKGGLEAQLAAGLPCIALDHTTPIPITNRYATPQALGPDRLAAAVGAQYLYPNRAVLAIDAGTTITYELVTPQGEYLGGAISPGLSIRFRGLQRYTLKLPLVSPSSTFAPIGNNTQDCIRVGVQQGLLHEVDGYIQLIKSLYPGLVVVITGGDAGRFEKNLKSSIFVIPNLVLVGLNRILNHNA